MPIHFGCPKCARTLAIATRKAGTEITCPACTQRIIVPTPLPEKPLPGILLEAAPDVSEPSAQSLEFDTPELTDQHQTRQWGTNEPRASEPEDDSEYLIALRRRKRGSNPALMIGIALTAAFLILVAVLVLLYGRTEQRADKATTNQPQKKAVAHREAKLPDKTDDSQSFFNTVKDMFCLLFFLAIYFVPSVIAIARRHNNIVPILVVNFFLGWLLIGWVISLSWAFTDLKHLETRRRSWL